MTLLVDGVFFQLAQSGIARVWRAVLPQLAEHLAMPVVLLDRGGVGEIAGVELVPFPTYKQKFNPQDSALIERMCRHYGAKAFVSTYYTTPLRTPSLSVIYDMIPERLGFELDARDWREKELAIAHARRHVCISHNTRKDLLDFYPELDPAGTTVAHCGVDPSIFARREEAAVAELKERLGLDRPYFIFVGSRRQHRNYKNASLFFDAVRTLDGVDFDVLCVGGEPLDASEASSDAGPRLIRADLSDPDLALAYGGAEALVYPSLYEGFGLPVAEAMSCGCPVISTNHGSLAEVAADAAFLVDGHSVAEMAAALSAVRQPAVRERLVEAGLAHSARFRWERFAAETARAIRGVVEEAEAGAYRDFYDRWAQLRAIQGEVDALS